MVGIVIFVFVEQLAGEYSPKITGMIIGLDSDSVKKCLINFDYFLSCVDQAF